MATHSSILAWRVPKDRGAWWDTVHRVTQSRTQLSNEAQHSMERLKSDHYVSVRASLEDQSVKIHLQCRRPKFNPESVRSHGEGNSNPLYYSCLENPTDRGAWWTTVHEVTSVGYDLVANPPPSPYGGSTQHSLH